MNCFKHVIRDPLVIFRYLGVLGILAFIGIHCAHKAAPLVKDRLNPKLTKISSISNREVLFTFSEELDTLNLPKDNFLIAAADETLEIITAYPSLSASEIIVITGLQSAKNYEATGYVYDKAENKGTFMKTFAGADRPDTVKPWLKNYSKGSRNVIFRLSFAKAMDTASVKYYIVPRKNMVPAWSGYRNLSLIPAAPGDSLHYDTTYYLYLKEARDLSGNTLTGFIASITPDTTYQPLSLKGKAVIFDTTALTGIALLRREYPIGLARVSNGRFSFEVRDSSTYTVEIITEKYYGKGEITLGQENVITLKPEECILDTIID